MFSKEVKHIFRHLLSNINMNLVTFFPLHWFSFHVHCAFFFLLRFLNFFLFDSPGLFTYVLLFNSIYGMFWYAEVSDLKHTNIYIHLLLYNFFHYCWCLESLPIQRSKSRTFYSSYLMVSLFSHFAVSAIWNLFCSIVWGEDGAILSPPHYTPPTPWFPRHHS